MSTADRPHPVQIFVAGTDTDVGKTYCATLIARRFVHSRKRVGVYKPAASGCRREGGEWVSDDAVRLWEAAGRPGSLEAVCPQRFEAALAPPEAARLEGRDVDAERLVAGASEWTRQELDVLIIEGAGGLMSPLAEGVLNLDLLLRFPAARLLVVAANRLGVIHQVLATCMAAESRGVTPRGIILSEVGEVSDASVASNARQIAFYTDVPILGTVKHGGDGESLELDGLLE